MQRNLWDLWVPGVLGKNQIAELGASGHLLNVEQHSIDASAFDLHLSDDAYEATCGSVKPSGGNPYLHFAVRERLLRRFEPEDGRFCLQRRQTYVFPLRERLANLKGSGIWGQATAKSSVGRMDVLARLIVDGMSGYEGFDHRNLTTGDMFLEITPMTFPVCVRPGASLSQLRLFNGAPHESEISGNEIWRSALCERNREHDGTLSVDLSDTVVGGQPVAAFVADASALQHDFIALWEDDRQPKPDPTEFWRFERPDDNHRLRITADRFYILRSKERIRLPESVAVYCRATDETIGEMRIHYAGFVHPWFGRDQPDRGTPLIFEVRGHEIDVSLVDGETMARLIFYRMSENSRSQSVYKDQELQLSKFFAPWPAVVKVDKDGRVNAESSSAD